VIYTLRFNSKDEDDMATYKLMMKAEAMHSVIHDMAQELRSKRKYGDGDRSYQRAYQEINAFFCESCRENEVDPYE